MGDHRALRRSGWVLGVLVLARMASAGTPAATMDSAFHESLYYYARCDWARAYRLMDQALQERKPTEDWEFHLLLYKRLFQLDTLSGFESHGPSPLAKKRIRQIQDKTQKSASDHVKLAVLLYRRGLPIFDTSELKTIAKEHADSPWAEWAHWMLVKAELWQYVGGIVLEKGVPFAPSARRLLADRIVASGPISDGSMMKKWMLRRLAVAVHGQIERAEAYHERAQQLNKAVRATVDLRGTGEAVTRAFEELGGFNEVEHGLFRVMVGTPGGRKGASDIEAIWRYFEHIREGGVTLPQVIPEDKEEFLEETRDYLDMRSIIIKRIRQRNKAAKP